jgi:hypothetical protein
LAYKPALANPESLGRGFWGAQDVGPAAREVNAPGDGGEISAIPDSVSAGQRDSGTLRQREGFGGGRAACGGDHKDAPNPNSSGLAVYPEQDCRKTCRIESAHRRDAGGRGCPAGTQDLSGLGGNPDVSAERLDRSPAAEPWGIPRVVRCRGKSCPRTRAVGNSQYPPTFATAWEILTEGILE